MFHFHITVFSDHGVDLQKPISTLCYNGNAASLLALGAAICGHEEAGVYFVSSTNYYFKNIIYKRL